MIEKETAVPRERRLVAAVIYNRLRNRMPLGIDATIRYGLDIPGTESLTKAALRSTSPFNTRLRPGLPPTPIANPGLASIRAAANPAAASTTSTTSASRSRSSHYFTARRAGLPPQGLPVRLRLRLTLAIARRSADAPRCVRTCSRARSTSCARTRRARWSAGSSIRVQPLGRQELAPRALVLPTRLEESDKPPVDVVDAHRRPYRQATARR